LDQQHQRISGGPEGTNVVTNMAIDYDFIPQYNIKMVAGKNFDHNFTADRRRIMINQSLAKELEFSDPKLAIGEKVLSGRDTLEIAGVIEDFHQMSLKTPIIPLVCRLGTPGSYYSIKLETSNYKDVIKSLESQWKHSFPEIRSTTFSSISSSIVSMNEMIVLVKSSHCSHSLPFLLHRWAS